MPFDLPILRGAYPSAAVMSLCFWIGGAKGSSTPIFAGPVFTLETGGHKALSLPSRAVNNAGVAVGTTRAQSAAGEWTGVHAIRWDASGAPPVVLGNLGVTYSAGPLSSVTAINNAGVAVGTSKRTDAQGNAKGDRAVRWDGNSTHALELESLGTSPFGDTQSAAYAISDGGAAAGFAANFVDGREAGTRAVRWDSAGRITELAVPGLGADGYAFAYGYAINDSGTVVGKATRPGGSTAYPQDDFVAVRWDHAGMPVRLGDLGNSSAGRAEGVAYIITARGTAFGAALKYDAAGIVKGWRAVRWDAGNSDAVELGLLGKDAYGNSDSTVRDANDVGTAVGAAKKYDEHGQSLGNRPVLWNVTAAVAPLAMPASDITGVADAINNAGLIVGAVDARDGSGGTRAALWKPDGSFLDLNDLIDSRENWTLKRAYSISDSGWIAGIGGFDPDGPNGWRPEYDRFFLIRAPLSAMPEGLCAGTIALAAACAAGWRRSRIFGSEVRFTQ